MFMLSGGSLLILMAIGCVGMNTLAKGVVKVANEAKKAIKEEMDGLKKGKKTEK